MLRLFLTLALITLSYVFQTSVLGMLSFLQCSPNLLLIITLTVGLLRGKDEGLLTGIFCGLLLDLMSGGYVGFYGIIYMYLGLASGFFYQHVDIDIPLVPIALISGGELFYHLYVYFFRFLIRGRLFSGEYISGIVLPEIVFTVTAGIFFYGVIMLLNGVLEEHEKRSALKFV